MERFEQSPEIAETKTPDHTPEAVESAPQEAETIETPVELELSPQAQEEESHISGILNRLPAGLKKTVTAGMLSLTLLGAMPKSVQAGEPMPRSPIAGEADPGEARAEGARQLAEQLNQSVNERIKKLGMFGKMGLVKAIKKHADGIRDLVHRDNREVLSKAEGVLKEIIDKYMATLPTIKEKDQSVYEQTVNELLQLLTLVETSSLGDLKNNPKFK